jgi:hypothetical protein
MRTLIATVAAVAMLAAAAAAAAAVAAASGTPPVIAYTRLTTLANIGLYVTGAGGTREVGHGQDPSVAPDVRMVSSSGLGGIGPALTVYETAGGRSHSFFTDRSVVIPLAWSPDSRYLAVLLGPHPRHGVPVIASAGLVVIDTATMTARTVATGVIRGASFAPSGPERLVYGQARTGAIKAPMNLYRVNPDGSDRAQVTADGDSLQPLWTAEGIVNDREMRRGAGAVPTYELWLLSERVIATATMHASAAGGADGRSAAPRKRCCSDDAQRDPSRDDPAPNDSVRTTAIGASVLLNEMERVGNSSIVRAPLSRRARSRVHPRAHWSNVVAMTTNG